MSFQQAQGGFFVQLDEDELYELLTCTGVGDVEMPAGDETPVYCPSLSEVGAWDIDDSIEGEAGFVTYSLEKPLATTFNYLVEEMRDCRFNGRVNWRPKGSTPDDPNNYSLFLTMLRSRVSSSTVSQPVVIDPGDNERVMTNADLNAWKHYFGYPLTATRISISEPSGINAITFDLSSECNELEAGGDKIGKEGYLTCDAPAGSASLFGDVYYTLDYGATWTKCASQPFAAAEDAGAVVTRGGRVIVARGETDAGNPAEVAISDDYGASWSNVNVGSTNGQWITSMWWLDSTHLWAATTGGYVYFSADRGETWTAQTSGGLTAQNLLGICAYDRNNVVAGGASGALIRTTDGTNWAVMTGPAGVSDAFNSVFMRNQSRTVIGSDAGVVYVTPDGGLNWTTKAAPRWTSGDVAKIHGVITDRYRYFVFIAGNTSGGVGEAFRSADGAASFQEDTGVPVNSGINDVFVLDQNTAFAVGETHGGTGFVVKLHKTS